MAGNISKSKGVRGYRGKPFTYDDFTPDQLEALKIKGDKGEQGIQGIQGIQGEQGVQGIQGIPGEKGSTPNVVLRYDQTTGNLYYSSDGILVDREYVDITSDVYRFKGSVNTEDDLPFRYQLIPNGIPTYNGESCGTYDEETHTVTIEETMLEPKPDVIIVPIVPITIKSGKYYTTSTYFGDAKIGNLDTYGCGEGGESYCEMPEQTIDHIKIFSVYGDETIGGTTNNLGTLDKILVSWCDAEFEYPDLPHIPNGAYDNGAVYNVLADGMNYAWTGTEWDALGGSTEDDFAREEISKLKNEVADNTTEIGNLEERISESERKIYRAENGVNSLQMALDDAIEHTTEYIQNVESQLEFKADKSDIVLVYRYRGSVETFDDLTNIYKEEGYVYNVRDTGINYAWNGTEWDALGGEHRDELAHHRLDIINEQKADMSYVSELSHRVGTLDTDVNYIDNELKTKADKSDVETLSAEVISIANKVAPSPASITLYANRWEQDEEDIRYHQEVVVANATITPRSKVDLQLSAEQITIFYEKDLAFVAENEDGVVTVYCIGQVPENDYIIQATVSEVVIDG